MRENAVKRLWQQDKPALGGWVSVPTPFSGGGPRGAVAAIPGGGLGARLRLRLRLRTVVHQWDDHAVRARVQHLHDD